MEKRDRIKKASEVLQNMKKHSEKKQLEYRGIVNDRAAGKIRVTSTPLVYSDIFAAEFERALSKTPLSTSSTSSHRKATLDRTTAADSTPHTSAVTTSSARGTVPAKSNPPEASKTSKGKTKSAEKGNASKKSPSATGSRQSTTVKSLTSSQPHSSTATTSHTSSSTSGAPAKFPKTPVNFQELMKLAEQKKSMDDGALGRVKSVDCAPERREMGGGVVSKGVKTDSLPVDRSEGGQTRRSKSPLGKQLLEKTSSRVKHKTVDGGRERVCEERGGGRSGSEPGDCPTGSHEPVVDRSTVGTNLRELAQSRVVSRGSKPVSATGGDRGRRNGEPCSAGRKKELTQPLPESAVLIRERFRRKLEGSFNGGRVSTKTQTSVKSNSFYGSAHAHLSKEGRPNFPAKRPSGSAAGPYQSSWAREMSECMEKLREGQGAEEGCTDEDDDSLDDFVVDDEEDEVSSAIREIFGYDKRR